jgi:hypothetical protein
MKYLLASRRGFGGACEQIRFRDAPEALLERPYPPPLKVARNRCSVALHAQLTTLNPECAALVRQYLGATKIFVASLTLLCYKAATSFFSTQGTARRHGHGLSTGPLAFSTKGASEQKAVYAKSVFR